MCFLSSFKLVERRVCMGDAESRNGHSLQVQRDLARAAPGGFPVNRENLRVGPVALGRVIGA
jgi:hypothetical protein